MEPNDEEGASTMPTTAASLDSDFVLTGEVNEATFTNGEGGSDGEGEGERALTASEAVKVLQRERYGGKVIKYV